MDDKQPIRRSILFAPGSRPERFAKAMAAGADAVCLDLEDGVAPDAKQQAREAVAGFLAEWKGPGEGPEVVVRINDPDGELGKRDLEALARGPLPDGVMIPKVDAPEVLEKVSRALGWRKSVGFDAAGSKRRMPGLLPLIETARGLQRVDEIAGLNAPLAALVFGGMDLAAELGARFEWEPLLYARSRVVHAAALAGVGAIDVPWAPLAEPEGLADETRRAARLGFTGKLAIHPQQIPVIHTALAPDAEELERARRILAAWAEGHAGVVVVDGRMIDRPLVLAAQRVLARAGEQTAVPEHTKD
jgi:citrate lyase beta subunit